MIRSKTLLLVDDDPDDREMLEMQLKKIDASFQIFTAVDGEDALKTLELKMIMTPDMIFLDINMPIMDGKQFLREIKKDARFTHIPVLIFTTSKSQKDIDETSELGANYFLSKPDSVSELIKSLITILQLVTILPGNK